MNMNTLVEENFLDEKEFLNSFDAIKKLKNSDKEHTFNTHLETMKTVFKEDSLVNDIRIPMDKLGGNDGKDLIRKLTGWKGELFSLLEFDGFGGYCPLHVMHNGGYLHPHLDHSFIKKGKFIHVGNCILYMNKNWNKEWGGATAFYKVDSLNLFNNKAKPFSLCYPEANRALAFIHDSFSFHGVTKISCPSNKERFTYYMDYYINKEDLGKFIRSLSEHTSFKYKFAKHDTIHLPFSINKKGNYLLSSIFRRSAVPYLRRYLNYLISLNDADFDVNPKYIFNLFPKLNSFIEITDKFLSWTIKPILKPIYHKLKN